MTEVQDIFNEYGHEYRSTHSLSTVQFKAMKAIENCRTAKLGGHTTVCEDCGDTQISYNSCRNRHCPKCQTLSKERWIENQKYNLLNVGYFHVVFTVPDIINTIIYQNQKVLYSLMFKVVAETLTELALDKKYLGARLGFTSVLHTWGQNLIHHPHIHCIVPGGGLNSQEKWVNSREKFFIPVKVLSRKFRGKFLYYFKQAKIEFHGTQEYLRDQKNFQVLIDSLYSKEWVVYCKAPFKDSSSVIQYLGRYTHRVAISNKRIVKMENGNVTFKWRDYKDNNKWKLMTLTAIEFIRRFLIHILPQRFMKIRHYGLLASRNKTERLKVCKMLTNTPILSQKVLTTIELLEKITDGEIFKCPKCGSTRLTRYEGVSPPIRTEIAS